MPQILTFNLGRLPVFAWLPVLHINIKNLREGVFVEVLELGVLTYHLPFSVILRLVLIPPYLSLRDRAELKGGAVVGLREIYIALARFI